MDPNRSAAAGGLLRDWRQRRRLSQLDLANHAETSTRHLSYLETGKAQPSRAMVIRLSTALEIPLRERNALLMSAGFAPEYRESSLDDQYMQSVRSALDTMPMTKISGLFTTKYCNTPCRANPTMRMQVSGAPAEPGAGATANSHPGWRYVDVQHHGDTRRVG